ncbi:MAG: enoyl-CoA hydratase [Chloroflexi bacterium]|nr:enoyl-CoA hydratase [Dehalococcoidia bacterium]MCO5202403.1 enoyl-CoA hydratase [Chloroflexota bacterium]MCZ7576962.1 enoyl-CoA hydratase [Dehalococcoidia bacterium]NJD64212.1 enoyl-CoA hydratase [Chloroflexota bacterium]PWB46980.1 MAG: enoyl-CoA hydratase [Dehalococcoidia bacterium]
MSDTVLFTTDGAVGVMTLNRPESLNAMNPEMLDTMFRVAEKAAADPAIRCLVITGNGRGFSAGGDVKAMASGGRDGGGGGSVLSGADALRQQEEISRLLYEMPKPTVAAINGVAAGAGLSVALAADLRVASDQARFTTAFAKVGFSGDFGGTWLLQRMVGPMKAKELYFMSDVFDAQRALELGLVTRVVAHEALMDETMALARRLASGPTLAYGRIKDNFVYGATNSFADTLTREAENMIASGRTQDHLNAARAFVEKREPTFEGR